MGDSTDAMVSFTTETEIQHKHFTSTWTIKHRMIAQVGGHTFLKVDGQSVRALKNLAFEGNALTPEEKPATLSLNMCDGLTWLKEARNEKLNCANKLRAQTEAQEAEAAALQEVGRTKRLEEEPSDDEKSAKPRLTVETIKDLRSQSQSKVEIVDIEVTCIAQASETDNRIIQVLMPVLPNDTIKVVFDESSVAVLIWLVREKGFSNTSKGVMDVADRHAKRHPTLESMI